MRLVTVFWITLCLLALTWSGASIIYGAGNEWVSVPTVVLATGALVVWLLVGARELWRRRQESDLCARMIIWSAAYNETPRCRCGRHKLK